MKIIIISALSNNNVIGLDGKMPWHSKEEFKHFKNTTIGFPILMGRKTFEGIGKALPGRLNIIISTNFDLSNYSDDNLITFDSIEKAINMCKDKYEKLYICGGYQIYKQTIDYADEMILSKFRFDTKGDTYFPDIDEAKWEISQNEKYEEFDVFYYNRRK